MDDGNQDRGGSEGEFQGAERGIDPAFGPSHGFVARFLRADRVTFSQQRDRPFECTITDHDGEGIGSAREEGFGTAGPLPGFVREDERNRFFRWSEVAIYDASGTGIERVEVKRRFPLRADVRSATGALTGQIRQARLGTKTHNLIDGTDGNLGRMGNRSRTRTDRWYVADQPTMYTWPLFDARGDPAGTIAKTSRPTRLSSGEIRHAGVWILQFIRPVPSSLKLIVLGAACKLETFRDWTETDDDGDW